MKTAWETWANRVLFIAAVAAVLLLLYAGGWLTEYLPRWIVGMLN